ncbi:MAG TPA: calcium-binding protein [Candidatus Angelobacter sp.]|jgi:hypothetical protein
MAEKKGEQPIVVHLDIRKLKPEPETNLPPLSKAKLKDMIEEAIVDAYTEQEQTAGFLTMIQEHLTIPFSTNLLGVDVVVEKVDLTREGQIVAVCRRDKLRQRIGILDLPLPSPPPSGAEWIGISSVAQRDVSERIPVL